MSEFLLDTHALLWASGDSARLSSTARRHIQSGECYLSCASVIEIAIKHSLGKLRLPDELGLNSYIDLAIEEFRLTILPIHLAESCLLALLPYHHNDPFDRILAAQAKVNQLPILSRDINFDRYGVKRIW